MPSLGEVVYTTTLTVSREHNGTRRHVVFRKYCDKRLNYHRLGLLIVKRKYYTEYVRIPLALII